MGADPHLGYADGPPCWAGGKDGRSGTFGRWRYGREGAATGLFRQSRPCPAGLVLQSRAQLPAAVHLGGIQVGSMMGRAASPFRGVSGCRTVPDLVDIVVSQSEIPLLL